MAAAYGRLLQAPDTARMLPGCGCRLPLAAALLNFAPSSRTRLGWTAVSLYLADFFVIAD
eukprot:14176218-Alexandrium_andersonii.AAC.1